MLRIRNGLVKLLVIHGMALANPSAYSEDNEYRSLKVMTFNVRTELANDPGEQNWQARKQEVVHAIKYQDPDLLGIQEATWQQFDFIRSRFPQLSSSPRNQMFFRNDRFEFLASGTVNLVDDKWGDRFAEWVKLRRIATGEQLIFSSSHWGVDTNAQNGSAGAVRDNLPYINNNWQIPTIIAGDFNAHPGTLAIKILLQETPLINLFWGNTFNSWGAMDVQLDYIMGSNISADTCYLDWYQEGAFAPSDHRPIICLIRLGS
ncbi:endonuclease/exonuclease/phosphatase family protein [Pseudobacteriovorax antillogorgiicola]|uniref:Metal-dependent hydrolase, endonuclease/exonuclease/phosphatase family n=1 Tax=Pseudobacteriovorax antillogorgiicola TaxID=1513793 RepID=A0A1Y6BFM9_9BACT|nr:endonuclease/exonuclease/phosphatase family protein [Pseudobacteriovorax antillogorgiicola]TCS56450.1 endonuclease/exonuclease/phosphatase family metal-dependent hydrolase [Pseudobacteriovorax antillogorgiicola]SMF05314.1 Metal-dependent hydrolase, endonuclease/exonuclease/phosphatase family [Pseudobacteriovorax antillogorgiicola]